MDKWEEAAKGRAKECTNVENEVSQALDILNKITKKNKKSSVAKQIAQLFQTISKMEIKAPELEEWRTNFVDAQT
eukprot:9641376-Ditylum_brightwellii.AAC.1